MFAIVPNSDDQFSTIRAIAFEVWPKTYSNILSEAQLEYMLEMMYSVASLQEQMNQKKHHFIILYEDSEAIGFASYEHHVQDSNKTKIHKLYVLSSQQGKGAGKALMNFIQERAKKVGDAIVYLNVNKYNPAYHFYNSLGFITTKEEVIDIGMGYVMDDYVMKQKIH